MNEVTPKQKRGRYKWCLYDVHVNTQSQKLYHYWRSDKAKLFVIAQLRLIVLTSRKTFYCSVRKDVDGKHMLWVILTMSFKASLKCFKSQTLPCSRYGAMQGLRCSSPTPSARGCWPLWEATTNTTTTATGQRPHTQAPWVSRHVYTFTFMCALCSSSAGIAWHCVVWTVPPVSLLVLLCSQCWDSWLMNWTCRCMKLLLLVS